MRQVFTSLPYIPPREPALICRWIVTHGTIRHLAKGEVLKYGGEENRLFLVLDGLCAYYIAGELTGQPSIMSLLPPARTVGDITATAHTACNVQSRAVTPAMVMVCSPSSYREMLEEQPELMQLKLVHAIQKEESTLEGMVANFTLPPEQRLKILFKALALEAKAEAESDTQNSQGFTRLPFRLSDEVIGQVVNLKRPTVSRITNDWRRAGLMRKIGLDREVHDALFEDIYDWLDRPDLPKPNWLALRT